MIRRCIFICTIFCVLTLVAIEGRRVLLRPIPASEVRRILRQAGREDVIPEGRVISHGLAAVKGFALGFKKGVVGVAIVDGLAALSGSSSSSSSSSSSDANKPSVSYNGTTNEICFTSRSATSDIVASGEARAIGDKLTPTTIAGTGTTTDATTPTADVTNTGTGAGSDTVSETETTTAEDEPTVSCISVNKT